ncbi:MAG TPA: Crp/Fnr family transcriptional regulator [Gammaproteobacteria bacterium]|nr:Crp/Fnr family transcriptional regulator [Gammaproteobacteria bacterium]
MDRQQRQTLVDLADRLSPADRATLIAFAEFLLQRHPAATAPDAVPEPARPRAVPEPEAIPRPEQERVVAAIRRLSKTYPMLNKSAMLGATSDLVMQHVMQGREAVEVIDELERIFAEQYRKLKDGDAGP